MNPAVPEHFIALPALDGRFALGYLAAVGTIELLTTTGRTPRLSWSEHDATARLHCDDIDTIDDLVAAVEQAMGSVGGDALAPGSVADLPPKAPGDDARMKMVPANYQAMVDRAWASHTPQIAEAWASSLATDVALDKEGRTVATLYAATSGQQTLWTMLQKPLELVRNEPSYLRDAFAGWRRVDGVTGEYLDHRVLFDAGESPTGESNERGVPGATWLALMSYPMIRTTGRDPERPISTGWFRDGRRLRMRWGLWSQPLDRSAIRALWEHPLLTKAARATPESVSQPETPDTLNKKLDALGVFMVCTAERRKLAGRNFAGVLAPA